MILKEALHPFGRTAIVGTEVLVEGIVVGGFEVLDDQAGVGDGFALVFDEGEFVLGGFL